MMDSYKKKTRLLQIFNSIGFILTITINALANIIPLNGQTTGQVSDAYPNLFAPAAITFSIWGLIYIGLGFFIIYQLGFIGKDSKNHINLVNRIGWSFIIGSLANASWILAWHYNQMFLSVIIIIILLAALINIYDSISKAKLESVFELIGVKAVFSIYLGWISVATIANITTYLVSIQWSGLGISKQMWTIILILIATVIALGFIFYKKDIPYGLVTVWAFIGILIKHVTYFQGKYLGIITIVTFTILIIFASIIAIPKAHQRQNIK